jgi:monoamine oxidase
MDRRAVLRALALGVSALAGPANGSTRRRRVLVVGAGLAGLACALELADAGHDVLVVEAQGRTGGRVRTLRGAFADGHDIELGAVDFGDGYPILMRYRDRFQLDADPVPYADGPTVCHVRGRRYVVPPADDPHWAFALTAEERRLGRRGLVGRYLAPLIAAVGDPLDPAWTPRDYAAFDRLTLDGLLAEHGASDGARALMRLALDGDDFGHVTALLPLVLRKFYARSSQAFRIRGGNDRLPAALAGALGPRVHLDTPVTALDVQRDAVRATVDSDGSQSVLEADHAVVALPFSVLRDLPVAGAIPDEQRRLISELPYEPLTRVYLNFARRPWDAAGVAATAYTDLPIGAIIDHSAPGRPGGVLEAQLTREGQAAFRARPAEERIPWVVRQVDRVHPGARSAFVAGITYVWEQDAWARGAWAYHAPGRFAADYPLAARAAGRLHFAGEHVSPLPSTMEGALLSGVRAAAEVVAAG